MLYDDFLHIKIPHHITVFGGCGNWQQFWGVFFLPVFLFLLKIATKRPHNFQKLFRGNLVGWNLGGRREKCLNKQIIHSLSPLGPTWRRDAPIFQILYEIVKLLDPPKDQKDFRSLYLKNYACLNETEYLEFSEGKFIIFRGKIHIF